MATAYNLAPKKMPEATRRLPVARPLHLGNKLRLETPLLLAPMAGITSAPFRLLAQRYGAEMCVSEMIIASTLLEQERIKSAQLYSVRPADMHDAAAMLALERGVDHIDLNFGCPVRKITSRGGGSAVPLKLGLLRDLVRAAVAGAGGVPVTVKMRLGVSPQLESYKAAAAVAQDAGAAAIVLHTRYAEQLYAPPVHWHAVAELAAALRVPVIGNGDVYEGTDAVRMMGQNVGSAGVMVFAEVAAAMRGEPEPTPPQLRVAVAELLNHAESLAEWDADERGAVLQMRKFVPLYLHGFASAARLRAQLLQAENLQEYSSAIDLGEWDPEEGFNADSARVQRLKGGAVGQTKKVALPHNWLDDVWTYDNAELFDGACEG